MYYIIYGHMIIQEFHQIMSIYSDIIIMIIIQVSNQISG